MKQSCLFKSKLVWPYANGGSALTITWPCLYITRYLFGDYLRAMDSLREIMLHCVWSEVLLWTDQGDHFGGNQELASFPGCMTVLGTRLAQEY